MDRKSKRTVQLPQIQKIIPIKSTKEIASVKRVIDGDTIVLSDERKVRYIGIDTPEIHHPLKSVQCFGTEAAQFNKNLVEGKEVTLQRDISETDKYGRLLRYVWVDNIFVNEYLVKEGYAHVATFPPDVMYVELFQKAAQEARIGNKGLWNKCN